MRKLLRSMAKAQMKKMGVDKINKRMRYHMGAFTPESEWKDYTRAVRRYPNVLWTHQADMIAAHIMGT